MKKPLIAILSAAVFCTLAHAKPVTITRAKAAELFVALRSFGPGLTAENTGTAADNINALESKVDARDKALGESQRQSAAIDKNDPLFAQKQQAIQDSFDKFSDGTMTVELEPLVLSADEIRDAKVTAKMLALFKRYLGKPKS